MALKKAKRNIVILSISTVVLVVLIFLASLAHQGPSLSIEPEAPEITARRTSPENGLNILIGPEKKLPDVARPEPFYIPCPENPELKMPYQPERVSISALLDIQRPDDDPLTRAFVQSLEPVLQRMREANQAPYILWLPSGESSGITNASLIFHKASRIAMASALAKAQYDQDLDGAFDIVALVLNMADKLSNDGMGSHFHLGLGIQKECLSVVVKLARQASPAWLAQMESMLLELRARPRPIELHLISEWRHFQNTMGCQTSTTQISGDKEPGKDKGFGKIVYGFLGARYLRHLAEYKDSYLAYARMTYPEFIAASKTQTPPSRHSHLSAVFPNTSEFVEKSMRFRAQLDTWYTGAALVVAVEAYQRTHGAYPATLSELEPEWAKDILLDGFGQPYAYRLEGEDYRLYSLGEDARDDGGIPKDAWWDESDIIIYAPEPVKQITSATPSR